jgi:hypothetical protein
MCSKAVFIFQSQSRGPKVGSQEREELGSSDPLLGLLGPTPLPTRAGQRAVGEVTGLQSQQQKRVDKSKEGCGGAHGGITESLRLARYRTRDSVSLKRCGNRCDRMMHFGRDLLCVAREEAYLFALRRPDSSEWLEVEMSYSERRKLRRSCFSDSFSAWNKWIT